MPALELKLMGLTCNGCVNKVTEALMTLESVNEVEVTQTSARVEGNLTAEQAIEVIENLGFEAETA
ncbi:MAG: cation transporter [Marinospirillum sp.]|uniref:cation transporter n=1 Tax=Marinospirillum sp. TaxID=2183934 RepID=UPI0019EBF946|nr:cation transporter [Marinospirillum sp.]MBE0507645.1 cation transporter [Marinospirillum sp.]